MAIIKKVDRSATVAFCPNAPFLAAGSVAGAIDLSFSTSSVLEIFALDFASPDTELHPVGAAIQAPERFARLAWGPTSSNTPAAPYGLLAGGLGDGCVCVWNPAKIIKPTTPGSARGQSAPLCRLSKHQGAVRGLEFNPFSPNLLASGAADGELCIWDMADPAQPSLYPAMKGSTPGGHQPEITDLAWNKKVQHILATSTTAGTVVVWDLKKQRPVISFKDANLPRRCSSVQWNPEVATQLIVASDDDNAPSLQLWDLRNSVSPLMELYGHTKGVLSASWCPHDPSFILSSGKDNRVICWDIATGQPYREMPSHNWQFDVQWAPGQLTGVFSTATFEGQVAVSSLLSCDPVATVGADGYSQTTAASFAKAPQWLRRPAGASFAFGGKLVSFANTKRQLPTGEVANAGTITVSQVAVNTDQLAQLSSSFEEAIRGADREQLRTLCEQRAAAAASTPAGQKEADVWSFLQTHFEADGRRFLLEKLGFADALPAVEEEPQTTVEEEYVQEQQVDQQMQQHQQAVAQALLNQQQQPGADFFAGDGSNFFEGIPTPAEGTSPVATAAPADKEFVTSPTALKKPTPAITDGVPGEKEADIHRCLLVGNYSGAVDACLKANRHADALIVASLVGGDTWDEARKAYMISNPRPFMRVVHAVLDGDWEAYVDSRPTTSWRETLSVLLTSAPYEQFESLVASLAARLAAVGDRHAATLCFVCSGDVDAAVSMWTKAAGSHPSAAAQEALIEKSVILGLGVNKDGASSSSLGDVLARYAEQLAANGKLTAAFDLLSLVPGEPPESVALLRDRIYKAGAAPADAVAPAAPAVQQQSSYSNQQQQNGYTTSAVSAVAPPTTYGAPQQQQQQPSMYGANSYGASAPPQQQPTVFQPSAAPPPASSMNPYSRTSSGAMGPPPPTPGVYQPPPPSSSMSAPPPPTVASFQPMAPPPVVPPPPTAAAASSMSQPSPTYSQQQAPQVFQQQQPAMPQPAGPPQQMYQQQQAFQPTAAPTVFQPSMAAGGAPTAGGYGGYGQLQTAGSLGGGMPAMPSPHAPSPVQAPSPPPPPPGPPADVSMTNVDTSQIPAQLKAVVQSLTMMFQAVEASTGGHPGKKREMDDTSKKIGVLFWKMNKGEISPDVAGKLQQLCGALDMNDFATATHMQVALTTHNWAECSTWLTALKRLMKARQMGGY